MNFRFRFASLGALVALSTFPATAQDVPGELQALRKLIEQQTKQLEALTGQVARLTEQVEGKSPAPTLTAPAAPAAAPAAEPVEASPAKVIGDVHIVVKGESLDSIAKLYKTTAIDLQKYNRITDPKKLQIGQQLRIPPTAPN
jgi:LysM repeat protein